MSKAEDTASGPLRENVKKLSLSRKYDIPVERLSYEYIGECEDAREMEHIVKILRSGEEGTFPQLIEFAENKLTELNPGCKLLRKEEPALLPSCLGREEWADVKSDLMNWTEEVKAMDVNLAQETNSVSDGEMFEMEDPPIRSVTEITTKPMKKPAIEDISKKSAKKVVPRSYADWDKFDADEELLRLDTEEERKKEKLEVKKKLEEEKEARKRTKERQNREKELRQNREKERLIREERQNREKAKQKIEKEKQDGEKETQHEKKEKVEDKKRPIYVAYTKPVMTATERTMENRRMLELFTQGARERMIGNEFFRHGDFEMAAKHFLTSVSRNPTAKTYTNLALALYKLGSFEDAVVACDNALCSEPDYVKALFRRGACHFRLQLPKLAVADFRRVLELEPKNKAAAKLLANATGWDATFDPKLATRMKIVDHEHIPDEEPGSERNADWNSQVKAERDYLKYISEKELNFDDEDFPELRMTETKAKPGHPKIVELSSTEFTERENVVGPESLNRPKTVELNVGQENTMASGNRAGKPSRPKIVEISSVEFTEEQGNRNDNRGIDLSRPKIVEIDSTNRAAGVRQVGEIIEVNRYPPGQKGWPLGNAEPIMHPRKKLTTTHVNIEEAGRDDRRKVDLADEDHVEIVESRPDTVEMERDGRSDGGDERLQIIAPEKGEEDETGFADADCKKDYVDNAKVKEGGSSNEDVFSEAPRKLTVRGDVELSFVKQWKAIVDDPDMSKHAIFLLKFNPQDVPTLVAGELDIVMLAGLIFCLDTQAALFASRRIDYVCGLVACQRFKEIREFLTKDVDDVFVRLVGSIVVKHSGMPLEEFEASQKAAGEEVKWRYPSDYCDWDKNEQLKKETWGQHPTIAPLLSRCRALEDSKNPGLTKLPSAESSAGYQSE